ncbi:hypothetical protein GCM10027053_12280 [Intrasporangium mesophilum]
MVAIWMWRIGLLAASLSLALVVARRPVYLTQAHSPQQQRLGSVPAAVAELADAGDGLEVCLGDLVELSHREPPYDEDSRATVL